MALALGASAVWVGTRFICAKEAGAPPHHQEAVLSAGFHDTIRTLVYTGRPLRVKRNPYNVEVRARHSGWAFICDYCFAHNACHSQWETTRKQEQEKLLAQGIVPGMLWRADLACVRVRCAWRLTFVHSAT